MLRAAALLRGVLPSYSGCASATTRRLRGSAHRARLGDTRPLPWLHGAFTPRGIFPRSTRRSLLRSPTRWPMLVLCLLVAGKRWPLGETPVVFSPCRRGPAWLIDEDRQEPSSPTGQSPSVPPRHLPWRRSVALLNRADPLAAACQRRWAFMPLFASAGFSLGAHGQDFACGWGWIDYDSMQLAPFHIPMGLFAIAGRSSSEFSSGGGSGSSECWRWKAASRKRRSSSRRTTLASRTPTARRRRRERQRIMVRHARRPRASLVGLLRHGAFGERPLPEI